MKRTAKGFTFRDPAGNLDYRVAENVAAAQNNAAWASERPYSHVAWPTDWDRAYEQGFRIVPVTMNAGRTEPTWKKVASRS